MHKSYGTYLLISILGECLVFVPSSYTPFSQKPSDLHLSLVNYFSMSIQQRHKQHYKSFSACSVFKIPSFILGFLSIFLHHPSRLTIIVGFSAGLIIPVYCSFRRYILKIKQVLKIHLLLINCGSNPESCSC